MRSRWKTALHIGMIHRWMRGVLSRARFFQGGGAAFWRGLGAIVLGMMLAKWTWILFAPPGGTAVTIANRSASVEADTLFGVAAVSGANGQALVAAPNVRLAGVYAGSPGFAILELDGKKQVGVALGGEVVRGVRLLAIAPDHVVLESAGARQRIDLNFSAAPPAAIPDAAMPSRPGLDSAIPAKADAHTPDIESPAAMLDKLPSDQREMLRRQLLGGRTH